MKFNQLPKKRKLAIIREDLILLIRHIFDNPNILNAYVKEKKMTRAEACDIIRAVYKYNAYICGCCRMLDVNKIKLDPIPKQLESLIQIIVDDVNNRIFY